MSARFLAGHLLLTFSWLLSLSCHLVSLIWYFHVSHFSGHFRGGFYKRVVETEFNFSTWFLPIFLAMQNGSVIYDGTAYTLPYDNISVCSYLLSKFFCVPVEGLELYSVSRVKMVVLMNCDCGSSPREKHAWLVTPGSTYHLSAPNTSSLATSRLALSSFASPNMFSTPPFKRKKPSDTDSVETRKPPSASCSQRTMESYMNEGFEVSLFPWFCISTSCDV